MNVVIIGANRGIGLELAKEYKNLNFNVIGTSRNPMSSTSLQEEIGLENILPLDISNSNSIDEFCDSITKKTNSKIDILINNAGARGERGRIEIPDQKVMLDTINTNAIGPTILIKSLKSILEKTKIAIITSGMGSISKTMSGDLSYRMSKAAVNMAGRNLHMELKKQKSIVLLIHPGWVQTDMGGENADISVEISAKGIINVISGANNDDSGTFIDYKGDSIPW
jgi:NAD(P)-dependent dehydrogenase (short-subunit alcohol dehydrogenase family)